MIRASLTNALLIYVGPEIIGKLAAMLEVEPAELLRLAAAPPTSPLNVSIATRGNDKRNWPIVPF
jgi:riboflavin biosynthesis pyrimidine reductase